jgi:hypothetical protein
MEYVSAEWVVDQFGLRTIKAIGDDGQTYWVPEADTDVPPWPDFLKKQGLKAIKEAARPTPAKKAKK